jgi:hypothetical protein
LPCHTVNLTAELSACILDVSLCGADVLARLVAAVRAFNRRVHGDARVDRRLVPMATP